METKKLLLSALCKHEGEPLVVNIKRSLLSGKWKLSEGDGKGEQVSISNPF